MEMTLRYYDISGIERVNVHGEIKAGGKDRDLYVDNYIKTLDEYMEENS